MKKIIFASLMLAIMFTGCTGKKAEEQKKPEQGTAVSTIHLTKAEFLAKVSNFEANPNEWKYLGDKPCIVDFYATWCGPCKTIAPILEELASKYKGQIYIYEIDVDAEPELASAFGIQSIPTLFFCPMKGTQQIMQGGMPKESFEKAIAEILLKK
jgi:thioredoxin